ncbi:hypothetical protein DFS34DRAFT_588810 [Phlyctochytrium arcticum]|nr:hypothetical protein DFS34DRAFT_588810 [Phlyctochytrium arcticum]
MISPKSVLERKNEEETSSVGKETVKKICSVIEKLRTRMKLVKSLVRPLKFVAMQPQTAISRLARASSRPRSASTSEYNARFAYDVASLNDDENVVNLTRLLQSKDQEIEDLKRKLTTKKYDAAWERQRMISGTDLQPSSAEREQDTSWIINQSREGSQLNLLQPYNELNSSSTLRIYGDTEHQEAHEETTNESVPKAIQWQEPETSVAPELRISDLRTPDSANAAFETYSKPSRFSSHKNSHKNDSVADMPVVSKYGTGDRSPDAAAPDRPSRVYLSDYNSDFADVRINNVTYGEYDKKKCRSCFSPALEKASHFPPRAATHHVPNTVTSLPTFTASAHTKDMDHLDSLLKRHENPQYWRASIPKDPTQAASSPSLKKAQTTQPASDTGTQTLPATETLDQLHASLRSILRSSTLNDEAHQSQTPGKTYSREADGHGISGTLRSTLDSWPSKTVQTSSKSSPNTSYTTGQSAVSENFDEWKKRVRYGDLKALNPGDRANDLNKRGSTADSPCMCEIGTPPLRGKASTRCDEDGSPCNAFHPDISGEQTLVDSSFIDNSLPQRHTGFVSESTGSIGQDQLFGPMTQGRFTELGGHRKSRSKYTSNATAPHTPSPAKNIATREPSFTAAHLSEAPKSPGRFTTAGRLPTNHSSRSRVSVDLHIPSQAESFSLTWQNAYDEEPRQQASKPAKECDKQSHSRGASEIAWRELSDDSSSVSSSKHSPKMLSGRSKASHSEKALRSERRKTSKRKHKKSATHSSAIQTRGSSRQNLDGLSHATKTSCCSTQKSPNRNQSLNDRYRPDSGAGPLNRACCTIDQVCKICSPPYQTRNKISHRTGEMSCNDCHLPIAAPVWQPESRLQAPCCCELDETYATHARPLSGCCEPQLNQRPHNIQPPYTIEKSASQQNVKKLLHDLKTKVSNLQGQLSLAHITVASDAEDMRRQLALARELAEARKLRLKACETIAKRASLSSKRSRRLEGKTDVYDSKGFEFNSVSLGQSGPYSMARGSRKSDQAIRGDPPRSMGPTFSSRDWESYESREDNRASRKAFVASKSPVAVGGRNTVAETLSALRSSLAAVSTELHDVDRHLIPSWGTTYR